MLAIVYFSNVAHADSIRAYLDEKPLEFSEDPVNMDGTTLVQFRPLTEEMGFEVEWEQSTRTITSTKEDLTVIMQIDNQLATINGEEVELLQPPRLIGDHTMVPIRFVSESTGALVEWNPYGPEVLIFTESYWTERGITKEELAALVLEEIARIGEEQDANKPQDPNPDPGHSEGDSGYNPAGSDPADLNQLQGMYVGFRVDRNGYECGGMCWDLYTFLPDQIVVVGHPAHGGPERIDCSVDDCQSYTITGGEMTLQNGESYDISIEDGVLLINDVKMDRVQPVEDTLKLSGVYEYYGFYGSGGLAGFTASWIHTLNFAADGTFEKDIFRINSQMGGPVVTHGASGEEGSGTYAISGNTITFNYSDGETLSLLFYVYDNPTKGEFEDVLIGLENYLIED